MIATTSFFNALWEAREKGHGRLDSGMAAMWGRKMAVALAEEVADNPSYNPEEDRRVYWAREVLRAALEQKSLSRANVELEATMKYLRGSTYEKCGKDFAAEGRGEKDTDDLKLSL